MNIRRSIVGLRVLIVEDDVSLIDQLCTCLGAGGCEIVARAASGPAAVDAALRASPELVLMDVDLADEFDGIRATEMIREFLDVPVVYLTEHSDLETLRRAKASHAAGYVIKPVHVKSLLTAVEVAVQRFDMERLLEYRHLTHAAILASIADAVIATDLDGRIQFLNPTAERLTGWPIGDAHGCPSGEVLRFADARGVPGEDHLIASVRARRMPIVLGPDEYVLGRHGRLTSVEGTIVPVSDHLGRLVGVAITLRDRVDVQRLWERRIGCDAADSAFGKRVRAPSNPPPRSARNYSKH